MNLGNRVVARAKQVQPRVGQSLVPEVLANTENTRKQKHRAILDVRKVGVVLRKSPKPSNVGIKVFSINGSVTTGEPHVE